MIDNVRDVVLIVVGIVWGMVFLVVLAVTLVVSFLLKKYLGIARGYLRERVRPILGQAQEQAQALSQRSADLPRYDMPVPPLAGTREGGHFSIQLPFFRRRKPWWQRLLPG